MSRAASGRTRHAILGMLSLHPATGYEIRKELAETTSHFWKESYGQIYPTLESLLNEDLVEILSHETSGRETRRFSILPAGERALREWIRSNDLTIKPGRHELLLKLFFATAADAPALVPQLQGYLRMLEQMINAYGGFQVAAGTDGVSDQSQIMIGTTIDFGLAAARMQVEWCGRTIRTLNELAGGQ